MYDRLQLTNMLRSEVERIPETGLPLEVFPARIQELIVANNIGESKEAWLSLLGNTFTAGDAIVVGKRVELSRRSVYYALKQLCCQPNPLLEKIDHGTYRKLCPSKPAAPCTIALLDGETGGAGYQSAKVQCANDENPRGHE